MDVFIALCFFLIVIASFATIWLGKFSTKIPEKKKKTLLYIGYVLATIIIIRMIFDSGFQSVMPIFIIVGIGFLLSKKEVRKILKYVLLMALSIAFVAFIGITIFLYINVYDPLVNNEWKSMSFLSYPEWFVKLSKAEQERLMEVAQKSIISNFPLPLWMLKFEIRDIVNETTYAWTYKQSDKSIFYIVWYEPSSHSYHFAKVSRYWLDSY